MRGEGFGVGVGVGVSISFPPAFDPSMIGSVGLGLGGLNKSSISGLGVLVGLAGLSIGSKYASRLLGELDEVGEGC